MIPNIVKETAKNVNLFISSRVLCVKTDHPIDNSYEMFGDIRRKIILALENKDYYRYSIEND